MAPTTRTLRSYRRGRRPRYRAFYSLYSAQAFASPVAVPLTAEGVDAASALVKRHTQELKARGAHWDSTGPISNPLSLAEARRGLRSVRASMATLASVRPDWYGTAESLDRAALVAYDQLQLLEDIFLSWEEEASATHPYGGRFARARALHHAERIAQRRALSALRPRPDDPLPIPDACERLGALVLSPRAPGASRLFVA